MLMFRTNIVVLDESTHIYVSVSLEIIKFSVFFSVEIIIKER